VSRIIAGSRRGRRLAMPPGDRTRPTTDRVREALFSAVTAWAGRSSLGAEHALDGLSFADLYAGSGAVGLEAASRGAGPVLLVEAARRTASIAGRNAKDTELQVQIVTGRVERWAREPAERAYDVIFADPPYELATTEVEHVVTDVLDNGWVGEEGLLIVERSRRSGAPSWPAVLRWSWQRSYGETILHFAER